MEKAPLIPKSQFLPKIDTAPLLRELFQDEFETVVPAPKTTQNIITSIQYEATNVENETYNRMEFLENLTRRKDGLKDFAENVLEAYKNYQKNVCDIRNAEKNLFETHANYLKREVTILEDRRVQDLLSLKRYPLFEALSENYAEKYKLLQGDAGLPPRFAAISDFRVMNFKKWRRNLETVSPDTLFKSCIKGGSVCRNDREKPFIESLNPQCEKIRRPRPKKKKISKRKVDIFRAEPKIVFFTNFKLGEIYKTEIMVKNIHVKAIPFTVKPMSPNGPFRVLFTDRPKLKLSPGLSFLITVEFTPKSLDNAVEDVVVLAEDGNRLLIPILAYLDPPILKTHKEINECTRVTAERITCSYIECGECFTGDSKVTKIRFRCYGGSGEFFIMSSDNWNRSYINSVTYDNMLEIPPFRVYPVFFKMKKDEIIDLFVEFLPKRSGTHVEKIVIACDNGEIASLDLLADAVGWHSYFFTFQDSLLKELPVHEDDDLKVKYYIDFEDTPPNGKLEKVFYVSNNSSMPFDYQWKIREANISGNGEEYLRIPRYQVKIDPDSGTFEANSVWEFLVTVTVNNADLGTYRTVLSLYVLNLPYQCIEEDNTIIQPTGLVRNLYSQSLYGEEECTPELLSLQGTYENLQESIKSYVECQNKAQAIPRNDFCKTTCSLNPELCAKPLKKSKTFFNIGDNLDEENFTCACQPRLLETESLSESCPSSDKFQEGTPLQKNEVTWDFVDVLVDEVELWVEVVPPRVSVEPSVLEFPSSIEVNKPPVCKKLVVINHNQSLITCSWLGITAQSKVVETENSSKEAKVILPEPKVNTSKRKSLKNDTINESQEQAGSDLESDKETWKFEESKTNSEPYQITIHPRDTFTVPGLSNFTCVIGISASQAGKVEETILLSVNDGEFEIELLVLGNAVISQFEISPEILDFGALRQGARHNEDFKIINKSPGSLFWKINQFEFDFVEEKFLNITETKNAANLKKDTGVVEHEGCSVLETYYFDVRTPGIKCSILEVEAHKMGHGSLDKQYILTLGDVKQPKLSLCAPRFENAILVLPRKIYVGQKVSANVILTNLGAVDTFFIWGHSFGCHCRKLKIKIFPKTGVIQECKKLIIQIDVTALDEGIISHCYIPCFFCRSKLPLILSVVAIVENLNVTFEIIDYPKQTHADVSTFLKTPYYHTVLRIPWPKKTYNPTLNFSHLPEEAVVNMICECSEVEEEANRGFFDVHQGEESPEAAKNNGSIEDISTIKGSCRKTSKSPSDEDFKVNAAEKKKSEENSVQLYSSRSSTHASVQFSKPELDFSDISYRTPVLRQFAIRNETPIQTKFKIHAFNFRPSKNQPDRRVENIKRKVYGCSTDAYRDKLSEDQPLVLIVEPSEGNLDAFEAVCINVTAYGNTWGEYRDNLLCQINGIESFHLKIFIRIVGHPINFPGFVCQTSSKPILRFQPRSCISKPVSKEIKVVNRSAVPLIISWIVFLTKPLPEEEREDSFNLCTDSFANLESNHSGEDSTKSSENYIPKNASDSGLPFRNMLEARDFSDSGTLESFAKTESSSGKKEKLEFPGEEKSFSIPSLTEEEKSQVQQLPFPGHLDNHIFQVDPKEIFFEPFEEKKMSITFNPGVRNIKSYSQEFKGVLTGCVKLKPEDEKRSGIYYRPCGVNFASELMDFNGLVETPLVSFQLLKGDLLFLMDSNAIIKSPSKSQIESRKFLIKNNSQSLVSLKIEIVPGVIFKVKSVDTLEKYYSEYNPDKHTLKIDPGQLLEVELLCTVTYKDVMYTYGQLTQEKNKNKHTLTSENLIESCIRVKENSKTGKDPWHEYFNTVSGEKIKNRKCHLGAKDSLEINLNRMSSKSDNSICFDIPDDFAETEGEYYELWEENAPAEAKELHHISVVEEELNFVQPGLITQSLKAELHLSFPAIKVTSKNFDFGNVYIGECAIRYCSLINLTGFPIEFRIKAKFNNGDFTINPVTGNLPPSNYNSDIGVTTTIEFRPSEPCFSKQTFHVFCNPALEFDFHELHAVGFGSWNEKYKRPKFETYTKLKRIDQT